MCIDKLCLYVAPQLYTKSHCNVHTHKSINICVHDSMALEPHLDVMQPLLMVLVTHVFNRTNKTLTVFCSGSKVCSEYDY